MALVVLLTGPPATGKSTLADRAALSLSAPVLGWDWVMAALTGFETVQAALRDLSHLEHRGVGWSILWNTATAQLRRGASVVLDGVARDVEIAHTREGSTSRAFSNDGSSPSTPTSTWMRSIRWTRTSRRSIG